MRTRLTVDAIYSAVAMVTHVNRKLITRSFRQPHISHARTVTVSVLREALQMSWPEIARAIGRNAHSTGMELYREHRQDDKVSRDVADVLRILSDQFDLPAPIQEGAA